MFSTYNETIRMLFAPSSEVQIANIERAIYETTMPEFNLVTPPAVDVEEA